MDYQELIQRDISEMKRPALKQHIADLKQYRVEHTNCNGLSATECNLLLVLTHGELQSRSSSQLARIAIGISLLMFLTSVIA